MVLMNAINSFLEISPDFYIKILKATPIPKNYIFPYTLHFLQSTQSKTL